MINATNPAVSNASLPPPSLDEDETSAASGQNTNAAASTQQQSAKPVAEQGISAQEYDANFSTTRDPSSVDSNMKLMINPNSVNPDATRANVQGQMETPLAVTLAEEADTEESSATANSERMLNAPNEANTGEVSATSNQPVKIARGATPAQAENSKNIDHGNFDSISAPRKQFLNMTADRLIQKNSTTRYRDVIVNPIKTAKQEYREMSYNNYKDVMVQLRDNKSYSDKEKAYIWTQVADAKGAPTLLDGFNNGKVQPNLRGVNPAVIDQDSGRRLDTPNHTIVGFNEGYHGFGPDGKGGRGMGYDTKAQANARIEEHERVGGLFKDVKATVVGNKYNSGDANASKAMVASFHAYRDAPEGKKFAAFANTWIDGMISPKQSYNTNTERQTSLERKREGIESQQPSSFPPRY